MNKRKNFKILTFVTQFAINMLVPICMCAFAGYYIDRYFGTQFWFILLFFVGAVAGGRNVYILARKTYSKDEDSDS